jgi:prophage antirepressor-like protein
MRSKLPSAIEFQLWVTSDLLPKIRKMGQEAALKEYADQLEREQKEKEQVQVELEKARRRELTLRDFCASFEPIKREQLPRLTRANTGSRLEESPASANSARDFQATTTGT